MRFFKFLLFFLPLFLVAFNSTTNKAAPGKFFPVRGGVVVAPPLPDEKLSAINERITKVLDQSKLNGNILIAYKGYVLYQDARGYCNLKSKDSLSLASPFQLASVSKGFTAMAVMILKDRGLLNFDDTVKHLIAEFPYKNVTIRHLLNHTSGVPNYMYMAGQNNPHEMALNNEDVLKLLIKHKMPLNFKPGKSFRYSNTGYALLALLVERISGQPFDLFLKANIFLPLQMNQTFAYNKHLLDSIQKRPIGYHSLKSAQNYEYDPIDEVLGDKSIYSTVEDLYKWSNAWNTEILVSRSVLEEAFVKPVIQNQRVIDYGFGWRFKEIEGKEAIYHNGLWHGFTSTLTRIPSEDLTIIILNNTSAHVANIARNIVKALDGLLE